MSPFSLTAALLLFTTTRAYDPCVSLLYTPTHPHMLTQHRLQHRNHSDNALCPDVPFDAEPALQAAFHFCAPMAPRTCTPPHLTKHDTPQASPARPPPTPSTPPTSKPTASPRARPTSAGPPPAPTRTASPPRRPPPRRLRRLLALRPTTPPVRTRTRTHTHTYSHTTLAGPASSVASKPSSPSTSPPVSASAPVSTLAPAPAASSLKWPTTVPLSLSLYTLSYHRRHLHRPRSQLARPPIHRSVHRPDET